jgi:hypothetical protein
MTMLGRWPAEAERAGFSSAGVIGRLIYQNLDPSAQHVADRYINHYDGPDYRARSVTPSVTRLIRCSMVAVLS